MIPRDLLPLREARQGYIGVIAAENSGAGGGFSIAPPAPF